MTNTHILKHDPHADVSGTELIWAYGVGSKGALGSVAWTAFPLCLAEIVCIAGPSICFLLGITGLVEGKIFTGNWWVFPMKYGGFQIKPIQWSQTWSQNIKITSIFMISNNVNHNAITLNIIKPGLFYLSFLESQGWLHMIAFTL